MQRELFPINEFIKSQMSIYSDIHGNLSIRALSKEVDISHGHLSEILRGKYALKRNQATKILDFLETPAAIRDKYVELLSVDGNIKSEYDRVVDEIVEIDFELTLVDHTVYSIFCCTEFNGCFDELIERSGLSRSEVLTCINKLEVYNILRRDVRGNLYAPHVKIMATVKEKTLAKVESLKTRKKIMENAIEVLDFGIYGGGHCNRPCYMPYRFASIPKSKIEEVKRKMFVLLCDLADGADNMRSDDEEVFAIMPVLMSMEHYELESVDRGKLQWGVARTSL